MLNYHNSKVTKNTIFGTETPPRHLLNIFKQYINSTTMWLPFKHNYIQIMANLFKQVINRPSCGQLLQQERNFYIFSHALKGLLIVYIVFKGKQENECFRCSKYSFCNCPF